MSDSNIEWCDKTWNPTRGCSRVSEGCRHCYAERTAARFCGPGQPYEGLVTLRRARRQTGPTGDVTQYVPSRSTWTGEVRLVPERLADPLKWRKPQRIFVNSMSDLFHEKLTNEQIAAVFGVMALAWWHIMQVLTKRMRRAREWFAWLSLQAGSDAAKLAFVLDAAAKAFSDNGIAVPRGMPLQDRRATWPPANFHLGVSVENQDAADERIPDLLATPAAVRFISAEPLLGDIDIRPWSGRPLRCTGDEPCPACARNDGTKCRFSSDLPGIDHVIAGCESGPGARYCSVEWLRSLRDQCTAADVPFFCKQAVEDTRRIRPLTAREDMDASTAITAGPGSHRKSGGIIGLPYLDGVQHKELPR